MESGRTDGRRSELMQLQDNDAGDGIGIGREVGADGWVGR